MNERGEILRVVISSSIVHDSVLIFFNVHALPCVFTTLYIVHLHHHHFPQSCGNFKRNLLNKKDTFNE